MNKPYAESCDQNRDAILDVIRPLFRARRSVLEIGSGTGQHAVYFSHKMPHLQWHASDRVEHHAGIRLWLDESGQENVSGPHELDVCQQHWPELDIDTVFSANSAHIMHEFMVEAMFAGVGRCLPQEGLFALYGPFNYAGEFTSDSNARFDQWLKERDPESGIRNFEWLDQLAGNAGMELLQDTAMPANNRTLIWCKRASEQA